MISHKFVDINLTSKFQKTPKEKSITALNRTICQFWLSKWEITRLGNDSYNNWIVSRVVWHVFCWNYVLAIVSIINCYCSHIFGEKLEKKNPIMLSNPKSALNSDTLWIYLFLEQSFENFLNPKCDNFVN